MKPFGAMWTVLAVLCLIASFDINAAKSIDESDQERSDSTAAVLKTVEEDARSVRLPRKFRENSRTRRVHIENQHGFDGKVDKIHINSEEDIPGVRAYGMRRKNLVNNGLIERKFQKDVEDSTRFSRAVEVYGKLKEKLEINGSIESDHRAATIRRESETNNNEGSRMTRSIAAEPKEEETAKDLKGEDSKVFRPLFVYRQQLAKRQHRARNRNHIFSTVRRPPCHDNRRPVSF